jgi:uncharacterized membrane protein
MSLAAVWAVVWLPVGVAVGLWLTRFAHPQQSWNDFFSGLGAWILIGAISGAIFALLLALFERNRTFNQLSPGRVVLWGVIGGGAVPVGANVAIATLFPSIHLSSAAPVVFAIMIALGALCALGTLWLARRARV